MKEYIISVSAKRKDGTYIEEHITVYGDCPSRPFSIAHNLWNYTTPWTAAQRIKKIGKAWENNGLNVDYIYGTIDDMPINGDEYNAYMTVKEYGGSNGKSILEKHKKLYGY